MITSHFEALKQHLKTNITALKVVDWYANQETVKGGVTTVPAAYLKFNPFSLETLSKGNQKALITFDVILITTNFDRVEKRSNQGFVISEQIFNTLQNFRKQGLFNAINRTSVTPYHNASPFIMISQTFECLVFFLKKIN